MNIIKFNNIEMEVESYNKSTYFNTDTITSNANCTVIIDDVSILNTLAENNITAIQIYHDNELIYNLQDIIAKVESTNEFLSGDKMIYNVNLIFLTDNDA